MRTRIYAWLMVCALLLVSDASANDFYNHSGVPATGSAGSSAQMRSEFASIAAGFDKLPTFTSNANKAVIINGGATGMTVTTGTLSLAGNFAISGAFATTLTVTGATNVTLPTTGTLGTLAGTETLTNKTLNLTNNTLTGTLAQFNTALSDGDFATLAGAETLTNKTLTTPVIASISNGGTVTIPSGVDTLVGRASTDTLTNKTLTGGLVTADPTVALGIASKQYVDAHVGGGNPIINGSMDIWQRGTSFPSATAEVTADRWYYAATGTTGDVTISRSTDKPTVAQAGLLFNYSLLVDVDTADAAVAATDSAYLRYIIEGYDWRHYAQRALTFSFWVRSSKTGTYSVAFRNLGADRSFVSSYTIAAADTWEYKTIVLSASPSSGTWDYTNDIGLEIVFTLMVGSNFTTSSLDTWNADASIGATGHVNVLDNTANLFAVTGVKLELGSTATPIQYVPFEDELRRCMRYYRKSFPYDTAPAQNATVTGSLYWVSPYTGTTVMTLEVPLGIPMRTASPTFKTYNPSAANSAARNGTDAADDSPPSMNSNGERSFLMTFVPNAANTLGDQHNVHWTVDAEF